ncbi:mechanosensitive ion channel [Fusibacter bizertensis]|uniref:Mechanosensitive ion channel n=1 Tax=Fusibacter bizertensis TaxID=1488331 RepID=A0ABT6NFA8_9FIRM|nr:mechanosensitive ion channel domain-containing protein [Fusibacter bizertensis]MDH8679096.1 mechanosensitive ion channel [Fusibacter bizertensis]
MIKFLEKKLSTYGLSEGLTVFAVNAIMILLIVFISVVLYFIAKKIILKMLAKFIHKSKTKWDDILLKNKVIDRMIYIIPAVVIHAFAPIFPTFQVWIQRISLCYIVFIIILVLDKFFDTLNDIYNTFKASKARPIKGYLQVGKIIVYAVGIIVIAGVLMNRSPLILIGSIGAASAVLLLIFQDSILGFVAGIQLTSNNMLQIGDWIEIPKYGVDGDVLEISLHTVKVQNWDKTIVTIPTYALVSESFKNWKGMQEAGGRRIKRSINIDMNSIKFCDEEMLERFDHINFIQDYLKRKKTEIQSYNKENIVNEISKVNGRHLTNIGTFRAYIENYLKNHPRISQEMTLMVRQLSPDEKGLPLEIYVFTNDTAWVNYEAIQADIFDHILAVISEFDLRIFQSPTGEDLKKITN